MDDRREAPDKFPNWDDDRLKDAQKMLEAAEAAFDAEVLSIRKRLVGHDPAELAAQSRALWDLPEDTLSVLAHAFETLGSVDHTVRWLLGGGAAILIGFTTPIQDLRDGRKQTVEDVLTRIGAGLHGSS